MAVTVRLLEVGISVGVVVALVGWGEKGVKVAGLFTDYIIH